MSDPSPVCEMYKQPEPDGLPGGRRAAARRHLRQGPWAPPSPRGTTALYTAELLEAVTAVAPTDESAVAAETQAALVDGRRPTAAA